MNIWKNAKFRWCFCIMVVVSIGCDLAILFLYDKRAALIALIAEAVCISVFGLYTMVRLKDIAELSDEVDKVLHGKEELTIRNAKEGELYILYSELRKMTVRLRSQAETSDKDRLHMSKALADISHQLRTPLTAMNLTVNLLSDDGADSDNYRKHIHELKDSLARMENLTEALLKMAKLDSGTVAFIKKQINVSDVIEKAAEPLLIPMELKGIAFDASCGDAAFTGDMEWCAEALGNLIKNCVEHTPSGGTISVGAEETAIFTEVVITDTGEGFKESDLPHLFERFYRGENASAQSIGIGLALSRDIIKAHNGTIKASNTRPHGAEFTVRFYKRVI